jgi:nitroreductase
MDVIEAILSRRSIRSFKPDPVPRKVLEQLTATCRWSPSPSNSQPWEFAILGGKVMQEVKARIVKHVEADWDDSIGNYTSIHPDIPYPQMPEPYISRQRVLSEVIDSHQFPPGTEGLDEKRAAYRVSIGSFYGAPNAIIVYTDREICPRAFLGLGMVGQTIALAAIGYGLGTCIMSMVTFWPEIYRELLMLPNSKLIAFAIAIGYPDMGARVNTFERTRESPGTFVQWHGF